MIPIFIKKKRWLISITCLLCFSLINQQSTIYAAQKDDHTVEIVEKQDKLILLVEEEVTINYDTNLYAKIAWFFMSSFSIILLTPISIKKLLQFLQHKKDYSMLIIGILLNLPTLISLTFFFSNLLRPKIRIAGCKGPDGAYLKLGKKIRLPFKNIRYTAIITAQDEETIQELHFYTDNPTGIYILEARRMHSTAALHNLIELLKEECVETIKTD